MLLNKENEKAGIKLTMLVFIMKAVVAGLKKYPDFNASLDASGENLTLSWRDIETDVTVIEHAIELLNRLIDHARRA